MARISILVQRITQASQALYHLSPILSTTTPVKLKNHYEEFFKGPKPETHQ